MSKYLGAYMMALIGGNDSPSAADVKTILEAGGIECDDKMLKVCLERLEGKQVHELIAEGSTKFAACGGGGGGAAAPAAGAGAAAGGGGAGGAAAAEEKKVE